MNRSLFWSTENMAKHGFLLPNGRALTAYLVTTVILVTLITWCIFNVFSIPFYPNRPLQMHILAYLTQICQYRWCWEFNSASLLWVTSRELNSSINPSMSVFTEWIVHLNPNSAETTWQLSFSHLMEWGSAHVPAVPCQSVSAQCDCQTEDDNIQQRTVW